MIAIKTHTYPGMRSGYLCMGEATSAGGGILTITIEGKDYSSKIAGIVLTPVYDQAAKLCVVQLTSVAFSGTTTTILARVFCSDQIAAGKAFALTDAIDVYYQFMIFDDTLPSNLDENDTAEPQTY